MNLTMQVYLFTLSQLELFPSDEEKARIKFPSLKQITSDYTPKRFKCTSSEVFNSSVGTMAYIIKLNPHLSYTQSLKTMQATHQNIDNPSLHFVFDFKKGKYIRQVPQSDKARLKIEDQPLMEEQVEVSLEDVPLGSTKGPTAMVKLIGIPDLLKDPGRYTLDQFLNSIEGLKKNYAEGIATRKLINGKMKKVKRSSPMISSIFNLEEPEEEESKSQVGENSAREVLLEKARIGKVKAKMRSSLGHFLVSGHITNLRWVSLLVVASFIFLTTFESLMSESALIQTRDTIDVAWMKSRLFSYVGEGYHAVTLLALTAEGYILKYENSGSKEEYMSLIKNETKELGAKMQEHVLSFADISKNVASEIQEFLWKKDVEIVGFNSIGEMASKDYYSLYEALIFINEAMFSIQRTPLDKVAMKSPDIMLIRYNYLNSLLLKANAARSLDVAGNLVYKDNGKYDILFIIMLIAFATNLASALLIIPFMLKADYVKEESLTAFLCIPRSVISTLRDKCEEFLAVYDTDKEQDDDQTVKAGSQPDTSNSNTNRNIGDSNNDTHEKRRFQKSSGEMFFLFLKAFFVMAILDGYFVFSYVFVKYVQKVLEKRCTMMSTVSDLGATAFSSFAIMREAIFMSNLPIMQQNGLLSAADQYLDLVKNSCEQVLKVNLVTDGLYLGQHLSFTDKWLHKTVCDRWEQYTIFEDQEQCRNFLYGITEKGMYNLFINYYLVGNKLLPFAGNTTKLNSRDWVAAQQMFRYMLMKLIEEYTSYFVELSKNTISLTQSIKLVVILSSLLGVLGLFFILWLPYLYQLRTELLRTDSMLMLIPNEVIIKSKFLKSVLEKKYAMLQ